jgi:hypothetical protein
MLLINFYNSKTKAITKIIIQMITILILADIVWIVLFSTAWEHNEENEKKRDTDVIFWDSLWFVHKIVYILAYLELILKCFLLYYLIVFFKGKYKLKDLFNLNYDDEKNVIQSPNINERQDNIDNSINNYANESNNSYMDDFKNKY